MRGAIVFAVALMAAGAAMAQGATRDITLLTEGTAHRALYGFDFDADGAHGVAVGARGTLVETNDGGETWERRNLDTDFALFDIALGPERDLIVGQAGLVRYREGEGEWQEADSGTEERLLAVAMNSKGQAIAVGTFGTLLQSSDSGATWSPVDYDLAAEIEGGYEPHINDVSINEEGVVTAVGEFALVLRSDDAGESWSIANQGEISLFGVQIREDGIGYAVGQQGTVLRSEDDGKTWSPLDTGVDANFLGVASNGDMILVPGMRHMIVSDDAGKSWTQLENGDVDRNWYMEAVALGDTVFAVGHTGRVIRIEKSNN